MEVKPIQIRGSDAKFYDRVTGIAKRLKTFRAPLCQAATEFVLPKLESGELAMINGEILPVGGKR